MKYRYVAICVYLKPRCSYIKCPIFSTRLYNFKSSLYSKKYSLFTLEIFIKILNSNGPRLKPWGTSDVVVNSTDLILNRVRFTN